MAETTKKRPNLTLQQILRLTPEQIRDRGLNQCSIVAKQYGPGSREGFARSRTSNPNWYNEMRITTRCTTTKRYSYIRFYGPPIPSTPVWVWCSCEHFAYNVEYVLAQYGSSSVSPGYENRGVEILNKPPIVRNKGNIPYMCKHLILCAKEAMKQTQDYATAYAETTAWAKRYPGSKRPTYEDRGKKPAGPPTSNLVGRKKKR